MEDITLKDIQFLRIDVDLVKNIMQSKDPYRQITENKNLLVFTMLQPGLGLPGIFLVWVQTCVLV